MQKSSSTPAARFRCVHAFAALLILPFLATESQAAKVARVFVDSEASVDYNEYKENDIGAKYETYVFMEGKSFGGFINDKSLHEASFDDIVASLGENMKQRNYYPSGAPGEGDLLIIVHYGSTAVQEDLEDLFLIDPNDPYADEGTEDFQYTELSDLNDFADDNRSAHSNSMNNNKLGIGRALNKKNITEAEEFDLRVELQDERYFIILMAYDYEKLRTAKEAELLWTTRFSVPAIGTNFVDAYPALARAATAYYGTSLEEYAKSRTHFGTGSVDLGELETLGLAEEETSETEE